jgi:hypothetical protein
MKFPVISILSVALAISVGLFFVQQHRYEALYQQQDRAIALVQAKYDALLRQSQTVKRAEATRQLAEVARTQARALAPRYAALDRITGYSKKTGQK